MVNTCGQRLAVDRKSDIKHIKNDSHKALKVYRGITVSSLVIIKTVNTNYYLISVHCFEIEYEKLRSRIHHSPFTIPPPASAYQQHRL